MKRVVIGGTGIMGSKIVASLRDDGQAVVMASPECGVDSIAGEWLGAAMERAQVAITNRGRP